MKNMTLLGGLTPAQFMRDYWHKKPLLIRQAIPGFTPLLSRDELFGMAANEEVESRLITHFDQHWQMDSGPLEELPSPDEPDWTLLVQGANLHNDGADALLQQFRFLPDARLDDLMISYASAGGGVGPHFDSYDVFLLQAHGHRHWKIGAQDDLTLVEVAPLKILENFQPEQEFTLEPGDMLYLPPNYAHDGVAVDECMTYSIGFRAPSYQELGEAFTEFLADTLELPGRYADPDCEPTERPAELNDTMVTDITRQLNAIRFDKEDVSVFLGEYLTEPKLNVYFDPPTEPLEEDEFASLAAEQGLRLDRKTRMLYRGMDLFINGLSFAVTPADSRLLVALADHRCLAGNMLQDASADLADAFYTWYVDGWLHLDQGTVT